MTPLFGCMPDATVFLHSFRHDSTRSRTLLPSFVVYRTPARISPARFLSFSAFTFVRSIHLFLCVWFGSHFHTVSAVYAVRPAPFSNAHLSSGLPHTLPITRTFTPHISPTLVCAFSVPGRFTCAAVTHVWNSHQAPPRFTTNTTRLRFTPPGYTCTDASATAHLFHTLFLHTCGRRTPVHRLCRLHITMVPPLHVHGFLCTGCVAVAGHGLRTYARFIAVTSDARSSSHLSFGPLHYISDATHALVRARSRVHFCVCVGHTATGPRAHTVRAHRCVSARFHLTFSYPRTVPRAFGLHTFSRAAHCRFAAVVAGFTLCLVV